MVSLTPSSTTDLFALLTALRRHLHKHAEVTWQEFQTQATIQTYLVEHAGIAPEDIHVCATTGLVVNIFGPTTSDEAAPPGLRCVAFRGDTDALPMTERNPHLEYASSNTGAAHMCGHDGHVASLVGFAIVLQRVRHLLPPNTSVRLLFQPAEEGGFGAVKMIEDGCLDGVDEVYGYHNGPFPLNTVSVRAGPMMAHAAFFSITVSGPGGHGSAPHQTQDPVLAAGHIIVAVQSIMSRSVAAQESAVISITQVHGGEADNVIPSRVTLSGTIRDFSPDVFDIITARLTAIATHTAAAYGTTATVDVRDCYPVTVNAHAQASIVADIVASTYGSDKVSSLGLPVMGSEDFSYYLQKIPGAFYFVGTNEGDAAETLPAIAPCSRQNRNPHSDTYDFNDAILPLTLRLFLEIAQHRLGCTLYSKEDLNLISKAA
ncbi:hypothetical protein SDRG_00468 [Saprolegnia diclina VS20]|uniref:Peptidase M20 dimerisation domain-containing protein n=1 Tax=Saprolegnia diclina (strain VS20) TaxID=1156394 RepID=T0R8E7_SAPDV|nr:hypothetical protein SDRG_00468 [Saprolegnia diclina VS20]EQC42745.1 hypothetical protein SDRG_00468 [Saprolegnia diclina VS20]|eukprot:XP_008604168.1 hypothetical protein SDRG_00468 [Saprolegnia diclina VS20]